MIDRTIGVTETNRSLRDRGAVLLISCYELGHQPFNIASPLGFLERAGFAPSALDISIEPLDRGAVGRAQFVGISVPMHTALRLGVRVAERVREINPDCHICFYGLYASLNADYLLEKFADSAIGGEFEGALLALIESLADGSRGGIKGVSRRGQPAAPPLERLPFPVPSRSGLPPMDRYARLERSGSREIVGYVEASRGCLHHCLHCPIPAVYQGRFFIVPREVVLEDVRRLVGGGARHITFGDPDFLNGPGHSLGMVRRLHDQYPDLTFDFTAKVEHILAHRAIFPELGRLGCLFMVSAFESINDTVLAHLEKGHTRSDIHQALEITRGAGIVLRPSLLPFTPWTTPRDYLDLLEFVESESLIDQVDPVQYTIRLLIPPGSLLLALPSVQPFIGRLHPEAFTYAWEHPDPGMDRLHAAVSARVHEAARTEEDPATTFQGIWEIAHRMCGENEGVPPRVPAAGISSRSPRLSEPWFCCAEPTEDQLAPVKGGIRGEPAGEAPEVD